MSRPADPVATPENIAFNRGRDAGLKEAAFRKEAIQYALQLDATQLGDHDVDKLITDATKIFAFIRDDG